MNDYKRLIYNLDNISHAHRNRSLAPRHWADNSFFKVWAWHPGEVLKYSSFWTKWNWVPVSVSSDPELQPGGKYHRSVSNYGFRPGPRSVAEVKRYYSLDEGETWKFVNFNINQWSENKKKTAEEKNFDDLVLQSKKDFLRERTRQQAKERKERNKKEAEKLGISLEEYKARRAAERKKKKEKNKMVKMVDDTERRMEVASVVSELKEEVDKLSSKLVDSNSNLRLSHIRNNKKNLEKAIRVLRSWQGQ